MNKKFTDLLLTTKDQTILWLYVNKIFDQIYYCNYYIASNPNCSIELLKILAKDKDIYTIIDVIENPNCSLDILETLSKESNWRIRYKVALDHKCSLEILNALSQDTNENVFLAAQQKLNDKSRSV